MANYIQEIRALTGSRPLILNTSAGALLNEQHQLLLQERADTGGWGFPGGYLEYGESFADSMIREFPEDAGIEVEIVKPLQLFDHSFYKYPNGDQVQMISQLFVVKAKTGAAHRTPKPSETVSIDYFDLDNLPPLFDSQCLQMINAVRDYVKNLTE